MGRYVYDAGKVDSAIAELNGALSALADITAGFQTGISTINSARGSQYIDIPFNELNDLQAQAEDVIETDINTIRQKKEAIEDYNNAGIVKKIFASAGMALTKFGEGVFEGGEYLLDGLVSITGFVGGIFNSDFKNACAEFVAKDHVGDAFDKSYTDGILSSIDRYSFFSKDSLAANVFKGFGTAAPIIAVSMTGAGVLPQMAIAGVSGLGRKTGSEIQNALAESDNPDLKAGDVFNKAFAKGVLEGTKDAAIVWGMNKLATTIQTRAKTPRITDGTGKGQGLTTSEKIFTKTNQIGQKTHLNNVLDKADDVMRAAGKKMPGSKLVGSAKSKFITKATETVTKIGSRKIVGFPVRAAEKLIKVGKTAVTNHPGTAFAALGGAYTIGEISGAGSSSQFRLDNARINIKDPIDLQVPKADPQYFPDTTGTGTTNPNPTPSDTTIPVTKKPVTTVTVPSASNTTTPDTTNPDTTNPGKADSKPSTPGTNPTPEPTTPGTNDPGNTPNPNPTNPGTTIPGNNPNPSGPSGGGGWTNEGYVGEENNPVDPNEGTHIIENEGAISGSLSEIIGGNEYVEVPTSEQPITRVEATGSKKSIIPVIAGLGAATAAGIGTKAYLDKKDQDDEEENLETETWDGDEQMDLSYDEDNVEINDRDYLDPTDEYAYQEEPMESYEAVNSSDLASMQ